MEFGRVIPAELEQIDFTLPPDREETSRLLASQQKKETRIFVGCAKWGRKDWLGKIYPAKTKESDFLEHYARHFNCIELNATFYRMPRASQTAAWRGKVGDDFKFCPKFGQLITHIRRLKDTRELVDRFLQGISGFKETLGPVFLMPHPTFGPKNFDVLEAFIEQLPADLDVFVELRHKEWFENQEIFQRVFDMLEKNQAGSVMTDALGRRDCVHMRLTTPGAFIRFVGNDLHPSDYTRIDNWVQRIKSWMDQGIENVYLFMHQNEEVHSPELGKYAIQQLNKHCGTSIPEPQFVEEGAQIENLAKPKKKTVKKQASK